MSQLTKDHLAKIMEAAIHDSSHRIRSLIVTSLEMIEREIDGTLAGRTEPLFWTEIPDFGHLQRYKATDTTSVGKTGTRRILLKDRVARSRRATSPRELKDVVTTAFLASLSRSLGFGVNTFDPKQPLSTYGIDSLSGVAGQHWFHQGKCAAPALQSQEDNQSYY